MSQNLKADTFNTQWQESFKDIQCYQDDEVKETLTRLLNDTELLSTISELFTIGPSPQKVPFEYLADVNTVDGFQSWVAEHLFPIIESTYESLSISGLDKLDPKTPYLFISNHRDIVMDPLILNKALRQYGFATSHCAIGDNLLQHYAANDLALLNRCFKVFRSLKSPRAMLKAMKTQSEYIRFLHFNLKSHVWIAQKEGRAKDNIDKTNPALIKMLGLAKPKEQTLSNYLSALNIVPVSFSYEWDPCDIDKAQELHEIENTSLYEKDRLEDFKSTKKGLSENKGRIHLSFGEKLNITSEHDHKDIAKLIDDCIHQNYHAYPINYACFNREQPEAVLDSRYDRLELEQAIAQLDDRLKSENAEIKARVCKAYSQVIKKV